MTPLSPSKTANHRKSSSLSLSTAGRQKRAAATTRITTVQGSAVGIFEKLTGGSTHGSELRTSPAKASASPPPTKLNPNDLLPLQGRRSLSPPPFPTISAPNFVETPPAIPTPPRTKGKFAEGRADKAVLQRHRAGRLKRGFGRAGEASLAMSEDGKEVGAVLNSTEDDTGKGCSSSKEEVVPEDFSELPQEVQDHDRCSRALDEEIADELDVRYDLGQRMLSTEGLLIKKVLAQGIAYPVRLRLLLREREVGVADGTVSLSLTWLEGDDYGLDLGGAMAVRPLQTGVLGQGTRDTAPAEHSMDLERAEQRRRRVEEDVLYRRYALGQRSNLDSMLLLAWGLGKDSDRTLGDQYDVDKGVGISSVSVSGEGADIKTFLQLEASSAGQRDALVACFQQLESDLRRRRVSQEDSDDDEDDVFCETEGLDGTKAGDTRSSKVHAGGEAGDRETGAVEVEGYLEDRHASTGQVATSGSPLHNVADVVHDASQDGTSTGGEPGGNGSDRYRSNDSDGPSDEEDDLLMGLKDATDSPADTRQSQNPSPVSARQPPAGIATTSSKSQHQKSNNASRRSSGLPPRGTQRYWSVSDLSSKTQVLRRRRSAGVRTATGQYVGGNLSRGTSLGPRNSMMSQSSMRDGLGDGEGFSESTGLEQRRKELLARVLRLHDQWKDDNKVAAWTVAVMKLQNVLGKSAARAKQRRWVRWCTAVRRANRARMLSDRRQWCLHAMANESNDLQAWYQSTFHREVYRIKGPFWYKYTGLEKFDKSYRKTPDRPLTELERRMILSCVSSNGTRYSDIAFHDFTAQAVLTREEMRLFWNLMERDVAVPKAVPEAGRRAQHPRPLRLLFYKGRLDLMWEGKPDQFGNTTAHHNFAKIANMQLSPVYPTATTTTSRGSLKRTNSTFSSTSSSDQDAGKYRADDNPKQETGRGAVDNIAVVPASGDRSLTSAAAGTPRSVATTSATLTGPSSPDSIGSGRGIAGLAGKRISARGEAMLEEGVKSEAGLDDDEYDRESSSSSGAPRGRGEEKRRGRSEDGVSRSKGRLLSVHFFGASELLELWFRTEREAKTWQGMLKKLAAKEKGYMYDYRRARTQRASSSLSTTSSRPSGGNASVKIGRNTRGSSSLDHDRRPPPFERADSAASDTTEDQPCPEGSSSANSADHGAGRQSTDINSANRHKHSRQKTSDENQDTAREGGDTLENAKGEDERLKREARSASSPAGQGHSSSSSDAASGGWGEQEYRIGDIVGRQVSAGGLCSAR